MPRIGERMMSVLTHLDRSGGSVSGVVDLADTIGPNGSRKYGYAAVQRCARSGLISVSRSPGQQRSTVTLTDKGRHVLSGD